jgi:hypothetical protein
MKTPKIQVTGNWLITFYNLPAEEPSKKNVEELYDYKEDLLQIRNKKKIYLLILDGILRVIMRMVS